VTDFDMPEPVDDVQAGAEAALDALAAQEQSNYERAGHDNPIHEEAEAE
jgi:hypothetical protein